MSGINIKHLKVVFDTNTVIPGFSENIRDGEFYAILGPTGSGKTTLLKAIAGLVLVQGGSVVVDGNDTAAFNQKRMLDFHKECGFVFQNSALISNNSIYENLSLYYNYHTKMTEKEIYEHIKPFLDYVGFEDDLSMRPSVLSTGEKMLVNIVRAISHNPKIVFWDNPFSMLDPSGQKRVKQIIEDLKQQKKTMLLVTNDYEYAFKSADRIGILSKGQLLESGTPREIKASKQKVTKELLMK
jgi:ABC-type multidrug transport system ATPase subunit